jgi:type I restriction enzyme S subunit
MLIFIKNGLVYKERAHSKNKYPITRIETISDGKINTERVGYLPETYWRELQDYIIEVGDILFSHINSTAHIGKTAIYEGTPNPLFHGMNLLLLRPNKEQIYPYYLLFFLRLLKIRGFFKTICKQAVNQASINQTELGKIEILLPPSIEQKKITEILLMLEKKLDIAYKEKIHLEDIKKGFMIKLLSGRIRVK